ncbi:MAG: VanZ family protein [Uliginosibacterium sp.]|nr:VanZ family protein [Uliginosibacterium sp.]
MYLEAGYAPARETNRLPRYLGFAYFLLTAYACLTPFDDFHSIAGSPLEFLIQGWPRYFIPLDAALNVLGFVPLGFLVAAAQRGKTPPRQALIRAALLCTAFSFSLEFCQNYLAERVASNLDLACNALGGLFGAAAGARWRHVMVPGGWVHAWRHRRLPAGRRGEIGILLIFTWWLTQVDPVAALFASGDLRPVFDLVAPIGFSVQRYVWFEAATVCCSLISIGLFFRCGLRNPSPWLAGFLILAGIGVKAMAAAWFVVPADPWLWATPGTGWGLALGFVGLSACWRLRPSTRLALANLALLMATVLVNLAPANPFEEASQHLSRSGHFVGIHSLTLALSLAWPFCALSWLAFSSAPEQT